MCGLNHKCIYFIMGVMLGILIGYKNEDRIEDLTNEACIQKRKMEKKMSQFKNEYDL